MLTAEISPKMSLQYDDWIFPTHDICTNDTVDQLHHNNKLLYQNVLNKLSKGRTWYGLHFDWPGNFQIPDNADTYVFSWHLENWDNFWLDAFCKNHPEQQIVVIGEFAEVAQHKNLKTLVYHCWHLYVPYLIEIFGKKHKFITEKHYRLSSLCNKPSYYKSLVTAFLLKNYHPRKDLLLSWNANLHGEYCNSLNYLSVPIPGCDDLNNLMQYYHNTDMINRKILIDEFIDNPWHHCNFDHPAFGDSLINLTNETFAQSVIIEGRKMPGPYLSEKTWKALLSGAAFIPVGQDKTYDYFKQLGFRVDYPWPKDFDQEPGDIDRTRKLLNTIDWVFSDACQENEKKILEISQYNYEYIRSQEFVQTISKKNQEALNNFLESY